MPIVFITGATSGFGKAMAYQFAQRGYDVIINGRRADRLRIIEDDLQNNFGVKVYALPFDVRNQTEVKEAIKSLPHYFTEIDVLVNNAGLASGLATIQDGAISDWDKMIDTNIKGLLYVSHEIIHIMIARKKGHIVNIASIAGKEAYAKGNVYCATKHAVDALSKAMRIDLLPYGIKVTNIAPGAAETEFSVVRLHGDVEKAKQVYQGFVPLTADDIAEVVYFAVSRPAHVVLNDIVITPVAQANTTYMIKKQS
jgi:3-hydroxy acid dehydrogenase/malonic semialdehyde reductase